MIPRFSLEQIRFPSFVNLHSCVLRKGLSFLRYHPRLISELADAGYSLEEIEQCKADHIAKRKKQIQTPIPISSVFQRLEFPGALALAPEKMQFKPLNGQRV